MEDAEKIVPVKSEAEQKAEFENQVAKLEKDASVAKNLRKVENLEDAVQKETDLENFPKL